MHKTYTHTHVCPRQFYHFKTAIFHSARHGDEAEKDAWLPRSKIKWCATILISHIFHPVAFRSVPSRVVLGHWSICNLLPWRLSVATCRMETFHTHFRANSFIANGSTMRRQKEKCENKSKFQMVKGDERHCHGSRASSPPQFEACCKQKAISTCTIATLPGVVAPPLPEEVHQSGIKNLCARDVPPGSSTMMMMMTMMPSGWLKNFRISWKICICPGVGGAAGRAASKAVQRPSKLALAAMRPQNNWSPMSH